jgi:hypothetical protein
VRFLHNCSWPSAELYKVITLIVADCFQNIRYLNRELIREMVDFENVTDIELERKEVKAPVLTKKQADKAAASGTAPAVAETVVATDDTGISRDIWKDITPPDDASVPIVPNSYVQALKRVAELAATIAGSAARPVAWTSEQDVELLRIAKGYKALALDHIPGGKRDTLAKGDSAMVKCILDYPTVPAAAAFQKFVEKLGNACRKCSSGGAGSGSEAHTIGMITWYVTQQQPSLKSKIAVILQLLYDSEPCLLSEEAIKEWYAADAKDVTKYLPSGFGTAEEQVAAVTALKAAKGLPELIEWFDEAEEDSEEEDSD